MKPENGQHIKCILKNNSLVEGIIDKWSDSEIILKSLDGKSLLIIHGGTSDIILTKIILDAPKPLEKLENIDEHISNKIQETLVIPLEDTELRDKNIKELLKLKKDQERRIITEKLKEHTASGRIVKYGTPGFLSKQRIK